MHKIKVVEKFKKKSKQKNQAIKCFMTWVNSKVSNKKCCLFEIFT
jgi:hypothetical protein